jgi:hypothetical protein
LKFSRIIINFRPLERKNKFFPFLWGIYSSYKKNKIDKNASETFSGNLKPEKKLKTDTNVLIDD